MNCFSMCPSYYKDSNTVFLLVVLLCVSSFSDWIPTTPEPLYTPTGLEMTPPYQTPDKGTVIYLGEEGGNTLRNLAVSCR